MNNQAVNNDVSLVERLDCGRALLVVGGSRAALDALDRTTAGLRLEVRGRLRAEAMRLTGQEMELRGGAVARPEGAHLSRGAGLCACNLGRASQICCNLAAPRQI